MDLHLEAEQLSALRRTVANSGYHLLLGAGASVDSRLRDGRQLPLGNQLADELSAHFRVPREDGDLLWRTYARAVARHSEDAVYAWLRDRFNDAQSPEWMSVLARSPWACVWTLNLDNTFENAYSKVASDASRQLRSVSWDDEYRMDRDLSVVHLHGHVLHQTPRKLVFSLEEYADTAVARAAWPIAFRDLYGVSPFVIIGARLRDEPDVEAIVARRLPEHAAPSFYVAPNISEAVEEDLRSWRLIPVRMTGEEFASAWSELCGQDLTQAPTTSEEYSLRVGRQFRELTTVRPVKLPASHDLLGGDEPIWDDVRSSIHAELDWIREGLAYVRSWGQRFPPSSILVYTGQRLTGRSTGLLAIALAFRNASWRTFLYVADERPDVEALLRFVADGKSVVLVFDGIADVAEDVAEIIRRSRELRTKIAVLAVDQSERDAGIAGRISHHLLVGREIKSVRRTLSRSDAARLVDKLAAVGRLGVLEQERIDRQRLAYFQNHEIFQSMAGLSDAPGFGKRVGAEVAALQRADDVELLFFAALATKVGRRLQVVDAARMSGRPPEEIIRSVRQPETSAVLYTDGNIVRTRQRWLALEPAVHKLGGSQKAMTTLLTGLERLSSRLNRVSQRERNATSLLVGGFMTHRNLTQIFSAADLEKFYSGLLPSFGNWSGRYWEQRAIMSRHIGQNDPKALARAESYALRAVSLLEDTYSYTTLGTILAARGARSDPSQYGHYYDRTYDAFERADDLDPTNIVTWLAFLDHSLRLLEQVVIHSSDAEVRDRLTEDWLRVHDAVASVVSVSEEAKAELARLLVKYRRIVNPN
ncbi:SIR2 family protein [Mycolicibacterium sp. 050158]|uniref:SIR2 family protein n=1 Tax=Mycolicibacterium sp. 050158 TaxID=3090602 RepID=UPI00299ECD99|nr:SIR2 family protein [Mycolicibacterium sp. 050158]MDX1890424.1 SIR2 family protein [Mycolicibacterium sp. 050158]